MPPSSPAQPDQFLVHHQGQVQGPFSVDFFKALVLSEVDPFSVIVESPSTLERLRPHGMRSALPPKNTRNDAKKPERQSLSSEPVIDRSALNQTSQYAVDSFNRKINRLSAMNGPMQVLVDEFIRKVDSFNAELDRAETAIT